MHTTHHSLSSIGAAIGKDKSVISRELSRNRCCATGVYTAQRAHGLAQARHKAKPKACSFTASVRLRTEALLQEQYSPEQISGFLRLNGEATVSHERIYQHIWQNKKQRGKLYLHLRNGAKRYRKRGARKDNRGILPERTSIDQRPAIVDEKKRFGDLEIDTIIGKDHKGAILTINDRATGVFKLVKLQGKDAAQLKDATIAALQDWMPYLHTITSDNGKEFAAHKEIAQALGIAFFFAKPYASWQRGANENLNGLIRQYIPKKTDFDTISPLYLAKIEKIINNRPRKRHNFLSPLQVFQKFQAVAFVT